MTDKDTTMKEPIQRYSQGFGGFGMLEKCNDGKLVMYADHVEIVSRFEGASYRWQHQLASREILLIDKDDELYELKCMVVNLKAGLFVLSFIAATMLAIIVFVK